MSVRRPLLAALTLAALVLAILPWPVAACSCLPPGPLGEVRAQPDTAVFAGLVGPATGVKRHAFQVEAWFHGPGAAPVVTIQSGDGADCGLPVQVGQRLIVVSHFDVGSAVHSPSICSLHGDLSTPDGQALLANAERIFGPIETQPPGGGDGGGLPGIVLGALAPIVVGIVVAGLLGIAGLVLVGRTRSD